MAMNNTKLEIVNEADKVKIDKDVLENVFGKPAPNNEELLKNEKNQNDNRDKSFLPLLEPDRDKQKPPLAGPEIDDLGEKTPSTGTYSGIDDGLLDKDEKPHILDVGGDDIDDNKSEPELHSHGVGTEDGKWAWMGGDEPDYPYDHHLEPRFGDPDRPVSPIPSTIDVNTYQQKKNLAQGMMDLALLSANANQLRYVLESASSHPYYYPSLVFISLSIIFQIAVGIGLIMNSRYDVNDKKEICKADKINNFTVIGIFLITIVNVFITSFSVASPTVVAVANGPIIQQAG